MESAIQLSEIERLAAAEAPDLADAIISLLDAGDPYPGDVPEGAIRFHQLLDLLRNARRRFRDETERTAKVHEAWQRFLKQTNPPLPPRFGLAELIVRLYEEGSDSGRAAVVELARRAPLKFGLWAGLKRVYKLAEAKLDAETWGVLAWRFDSAYAHPAGAEVGRGTLLYLRRRGWRFLRNLGRSSPALYAPFAVEALRHYAEYSPSLSATWIPNHVLFHETRRYGAHAFSLWGVDQNDLLSKRAFPDAWKRAAAPLRYLLETALADLPARYAIQALRKDFPDELRKVPAAWLARLAYRPLAGVHEFLVEMLQASPDYHQSKLKAAGLHAAVLELLVSPSDTARTYAIEYARAHAPDLPPARLLALADSGHDDTVDFAAKALQARPPKAVGIEVLGRALAIDALGEWAKKCLNEGFDRNEIPETFRLEMIFGSDAQREWVVEWFKAKFQPGEVPVAFWKKILEDKRSKDEYDAGELATEMLGQVAAAQIGAARVLDHLGHDYWGDTIGEWLAEAESLPDLDVERVKGLVFHREHRHLALQILGNQKLVKPRDLGLAWLLALARREDATLHDFAHRYLLQHMEPGDFADESAKGIERLFSLATGKKEPEPVRLFAQTYLRCHHPVIGPEQTESKQFSLAPKVPREAFTAERVWPALFDARPDVRKFAVAVTRADLRRWGRHTGVYDLADSEHKEVRNIAYDALLEAGHPNADPSRTLEPGEIDADRVFAMTESRIRSTREVAMDLIRRHYARLGGPERLAWLMQSNDRTVRMLAVRLLWEKHRPREFPDGWKPRAGTLADGGAAPATSSGGPAPSTPAPAAPTPTAAAAENEDEPLDDEELEEEALDEDAEMEADSDEADEDLDEEDEEDDFLDDDEQGDEDEESGDASGGGGADRELRKAELLYLVDELEVSVRTASSIQDMGATYLGDLVQYTELELISSKHFDTKSLSELKELLADIGWALGSRHEPWWPPQIKAKGAVPREELEPEYDDGEDEEEEADESTVIEAEMAGVNCPKCAWVPHEHDHWLCSCGYRWNTFRTRGTCPNCHKQWEDTACLKCKQYSKHTEWWIAERTGGERPTAGQTLGGKAELREVLGYVAADLEFEDDAPWEEALDYLDEAGFTFVGDIAQAPRARIEEEASEEIAEAIETALKKLGLSLGMIREDWWPEDIEPYAPADESEETEPDAPMAAADGDEDEEDEPEEEEEDDEELEDTVVSASPPAASPVQGATRSASKVPPPPHDPDPGSNDAGPFRGTDALCEFLRRILYGLPPGRSMEPKDDVNVRRHLAANVAKRNAIEVVRDLALEDADFARLVVPVLSEFTGSIAKGEWQACLSALVRISKRHPDLDIPGLAGREAGPGKA